MNEKTRYVFNDIKKYYLATRPDQRVDLTSNKILDYFEPQYAKLLYSNNDDNKDLTIELYDFLMTIILGDFDKQIHINILTALSFYEQSELTTQIKDVIINKYFK